MVVKIIKFILKYLLYFLSALIYLSTEWISKNFDLPTTSQIIFQISLMNKSINAIPNGMIYSYTKIINKRHQNLTSIYPNLPVI